MQTPNNILIDELLEITDACTSAVQQLKKLPLEQLNHKQDAQSWSALECIGHLNLYGDFYLPAIEQGITKGNIVPAGSIFKPGIIGNYFANLMKEKNGKLKKMKSPKDKNPSGSELAASTLDRFLKQQAMLVNLLNKARSVDLVKTKTPISLTPFIKLRLGDTARFFVYHIERHTAQAQRAAQ